MLVDVALAEADRLSRDERFDEAIAVCNEIIASGGNCYAAYSERSCNLHALGRFEDAIRDLEKLVELRPASPTAYFRRARWRIERGEFESALHDLRRVIELQVEYFNESVYFHLVVALLNTHQLDEARQTCVMLSPGFKDFVITPTTPGRTLFRDDLMLMVQQGKIV